ncbi:unnamed protein product [Periconia digitata]|uniref:Uncharacterized protein n=1 Tax=Periconia digitata TaxID=1303443 RepID=A0A9W4U125_9PLEO|nr:unnamed protein product [Periconia digitata]
MVKLAPSRKKGAAAAGGAKIHPTSARTDAVGLGGTILSCCQAFISGLLSLCSSPIRSSTGGRSVGMDNLESDQMDDNDTLRLIPSLNTLYEEHESYKRIGTTGYTSHYLRFDTASRGKRPPRRPRGSKRSRPVSPMSTIREVDTPSSSVNFPPSLTGPEIRRRQQAPPPPCVSCGLRQSECAKTINFSKDNPSKSFNISIFIDELDRVRLADYVWENTKRTSDLSREREHYVMMYLKHRQENTDKRVDLHVGFDEDDVLRRKMVVAYLCDTKIAQIMAYLGPHAAKVRLGEVVSGYLYEFGGPTVFGIGIVSS